MTPFAAKLLAAISVDGDLAKCQNKKRHATRESAMRAATRGRSGWRLFPYQCPFCACWHLSKRLNFSKQVKDLA